MTVVELSINAAGDMLPLWPSVGPNGHVAVVRCLENQLTVGLVRQAFIQFSPSTRQHLHKNHLLAQLQGVNWL